MTEQQFKRTDGQKYVEQIREEATGTKALPGSKSLWQQVKDFVADAWAFVFEPPYFSRPEPDYASDPMAFVNHNQERLMELANVNPENEPLSGLSNQEYNNRVARKFLKSGPEPDSPNSSAAEVLRQRAEQDDADEYSRYMASNASAKNAEYDFVGKLLAREGSEQWLEARANATPQQLVDRIQDQYESKYENAIPDNPDLFDYDNYSGFSELYDELADVLVEAKAGYNREDARAKVVRDFGRTFNSLTL
jgi:soluble cytochrome b562